MGRIYTGLDLLWPVVNLKSRPISPATDREPYQRLLLVHLISFILRFTVPHIYTVTTTGRI